jgi:Xaa-Pro aminopeptidase
MDKADIAEEIGHRLETFQQHLREHQIDGALIVQKVDLYYLSGTDQDAHLWIPASEQPLLMVRKSLDRVRSHSPLEQIVPLNSLSQLTEYITKYSRTEPNRVGLELDVIPVKMYRAYEKLLPEKEMVDISSLIRQTRMVKSPHEISSIRRAAKMADDMYAHMPEFLRKSETEIELAIKVEAFYRTRGHPGLIRFRTFNLEINYGHIITGAGGTSPSASPGPTGGLGLGPHYSQGPGLNTINHHEPILADYASSIDGYISDHARIFSVGELDQKFYDAHNVMLEVQDCVAREGKSGVRASDLYALALRIVDKAGLADGFMGHPQPVRFVGHGVGLEMDEWPVIGRGSDTVLEQSMVIALEPKYIFPGEGVVGIENTFVVTDRGMEKLNNFPDDIHIC